MGSFYCAQGAGVAVRKCTTTINARHARGFGLVAIFGIIVWQSAPVSLVAGRADILSRSHLCLDVFDASHMSYIVTSIIRKRDV